MLDQIRHINRPRTLASLSDVPDLRGVTAKSGLNKPTRENRAWFESGIKLIRSAKGFFEFRLANGLRVIAKQSKGPAVRAELIVGAGGMHDPKGKEGLAHLLEHVVFSNVKKIGDEIFRLVNYAGGTTGANTCVSNTRYQIEVPNDKLDFALKVLATQLFNIDFSDISMPDAIKRENGIVISEFYKVASSAYRQIELAVSKVLYGAESPLATDLIGSPDNIASIELNDLKKFYQQYYLPNNAILAISGDFDLDSLKTILLQRFSATKSSDISSNSTGLNLEIKPSSIRDHSINNDTLNSRLLNFYQLPKLNHRDRLILYLIEHTLTTGINSRLHQKLIDSAKIDLEYQKPLSIASYLKDNRFVIDAVIKNSTATSSYDHYQKIIDNELAELGLNGLTDDEIEQAINRSEIEHIYNQDRQHADLSKIVGYAMAANDWTQHLRYIEDLKTITNQEIKAFATKYLNPANRYNFRIFSNRQNLVSDGYRNILEQKYQRSDDEADIRTSDVNRPTDYDFLLRGQSKIAPELTGASTTKYNNDSCELIHKRDIEVPAVYTKLLFSGIGPLNHPRDKPYVDAFVKAMMEAMGVFIPDSKTRITANDLSKEFSNFGVMVDLDFDLAHGSVFFKSPKKYFDQAVDLVNKFVKYPAFISDDVSIKKEAERIFAELKQKLLEKIYIQETKSENKIERVFYRSLFPEGHDSHPLGLTKLIEQVEALTLDDIKNAYHSYNLSPDKIAVVGDIRKEEIEQKLLPKVFAWNKVAIKEINPHRIRDIEPLAKTKTLIIDGDHKGAFIKMGNINDIDLKDSRDYYAALLGNMILGNLDLSSRLQKTLRMDKALVYDINSKLDANNYGSSTFEIKFSCKPNDLSKSLSAVNSVIASILEEGISQDELNLVKSKLKISETMNNLNSRENTALYISKFQALDKDGSFINNFGRMIDSITVEDVMKAMKRMVKPESFVTVISKPRSVSLEEMGLRQAC